MHRADSENSEDSGLGRVSDVHTMIKPEKQDFDWIKVWLCRRSNYST